MKKGTKEQDPRFEELIYDERYKKSKQKREQADGRFEREADKFEERVVPDKRGGFKKVKESLKQELGIESLPQGFEEESQASSDVEDIDMEVVKQYLGAPEEEAESVWSEKDEAPAFEGSVRRLALMNYDWSKISAGDLMITFGSFLPPEGRLTRVTVYPSDFGLQKLKQEELEGPGDIFKPDSDLVDQAPTADELAPQKSHRRDRPRPHTKPGRQAETGAWVAGDEAETGLDLNKLRKYERERLKYYYAVIDFDSGRTADAVFEACNGYELEKTGIKIDLRAIPDDLKFPHPPKETCTEKPSQSSGLNFLARALTHTSVNCTWDEPELGNKKNELLFKDGYADKIDLDDYIAPGMEDGVYDDDSEQAGLADASPAEQSAATDSEAAEEPSSKPVEKVNLYDDFDKKKKKKGIKITFKNPLEYKGGIEEDNPLGKRVFSMKHSRKELEADAEEEGADFFQAEPEADEAGHLAPPQRSKKPVKDENLKNLKFKERMREKKRQAKLDKEQERNEKKQQKEERSKHQDRQTADLELVVGEKKLKGEFKVDLQDARFPIFEDPDLAIDPTSAAFDRKKHSQLIHAKKDRKKAISDFN